MARIRLAVFLVYMALSMRQLLQVADRRRAHSNNASDHQDCIAHDSSLTFQS
jgi:hypothetical protein